MTTPCAEKDHAEVAGLLPARAEDLEAPVVAPAAAAPRWAKAARPLLAASCACLAAAGLLALAARPGIGGPQGRVQEALGLAAAAPLPRPQVIHTFVPYAGYTGPLKVTGRMEIRSTGSAPLSQKLEWHLLGSDPQCGPGSAAGVPGACGVHIHAGTDCAQDAGGHYFAPGLPDPWGDVHYATVGGRADLGGPADPSGFVSLATGLTADQVNGHAMIVHDASGAMVACGIIRYARTAIHEVWFAPYAGYTGPLKVTGVLKSTSKGEGPGALQSLDWHLDGADPQCVAAGAAGAPGACGIHIHEGMDCSQDLGGHLTKSQPDPWAAVRYAAPGGSSDGQAVRVVTGLTPDEVNGHAVAVHDAAGATVACGLMVYQ